jgi:hypothetical protein
MDERVALYLELIAAKAKQLAEDYKRARLWDGDLQRGLGEINEQLQKAFSAARSDR